MQSLDENTPVDPTRQSERDASVLSSARSGMIVAGQHPESGLVGLSHQELRGRVLELVQSQAGGAKIHIDSSGLSLDQKLFVERILLHQFDRDDLHDVSIYFRKATRALAADQAPTLADAKLPFGLTNKRKSIPGVKHVIAIASGKGGVGKSTIATNLATGLAQQGLRVGLMDCDVYGPSAQLMLGIDASMTVTNGQLVPLERFGVKVVSFGFLTDAMSPVIWRGPMVSKAIEQLCYDVQWGELDALVLDLPPGTGDVQLTLAERIPISGSIVVSTPQDVALIDAHKAVSMFEKLGVPILGIVENMSHHICTACGHQDHIFGGESFENFAQKRKLTKLASIPINREIRVASDTGQPIVLSPSAAANEYASLSKKTATILGLLASATRGQSTHKSSDARDQN